jgi:hypothetical protein
MTRGSSINFKKSSAGFEHNDRTEEREPKHLLPEEFRLENECDRSALEARELLKEMVENAKEKYTERTGQKCQAKILSVEAVINLEAHHTLKDVEKINEYLEQKHGLRAVQSSIHRDEGHINDEGKLEYNLHAHVVYCNLDQEGKTILKGLEKADLRDLQSFVAEALEMTRGQSADITNAKHKSPQVYRYEKVLATNKDLKAEIAQLREQLKERGATRSEYAALEQLNRELKEQIKAKDLTISDLEEKLTEAVKVPHEPLNARLIGNLKSENEMLQITNRALEREVTELKETKSAPVPKGENEASRAVEKYIETLPRSTGVQLKADEQELRRFENGAEAREKNYRYGEEYAKHILDKHTNIVGKVDKEALVAELGKEFKETAQVLNRGLILVNEFKTAFERTRNSFNSAVKSTETALKDVFTKITGKSTEQVNEQRREAERAIQQEKIKQAEAQRAKEPEQVRSPSRGLSLGR